MSNTPQMTVRVEPELKIKAAEGLMSEALTLSDGVRLFLQFVADNGRLPSEMVMDDAARKKWEQERLEFAYNNRGGARPVRELLKEWEDEDAQRKIEGSA
jgi:antitoxin component of RelBE/YafQ-DinJ toxin-antitoxin module